MLFWGKVSSPQEAKYYSIINNTMHIGNPKGIFFVCVHVCVCVSLCVSVCVCVCVCVFSAV